jgi:hypothetical protein
MDSWYWFGFGIGFVGLCVFGWMFSERRIGDPDSPDDPLASRDPLGRSLVRFWNKAFWKNPVSLLVVAVVVTPLGAFFAGPIFGGRAAEIWIRRAGSPNSERWGIVVGVIWFALSLLALAVLVWATS